MRLLKFKHKKSQTQWVRITQLVMVMTFVLSVLGCGDVDEDSMDTQSPPENNTPSENDAFLSPCPGATWDHLPVVSVGTHIEITPPDEMRVRTALLAGIHDTPPERLDDSTQFQFGNTGIHTAFAVTDGTECSATVVYEVVAVFSEFPATNGVDKEDPRIQSWASGWLMPVQYGTSVDAMWQAPERAMGPTTGSATDVVSLGAGGQIELLFDGALFNGEGIDFAVFENSFSATFLELASVEVSSDGVHFAQFPMIYLGTAEIDAYGDHEPQLMHGLAGKYPGGVGTPFDLEDLYFENEVVEGLVDLDRITSVRITDIIGDGRTLDSLGHPIFDPYPTTGSAGFDLDGVGVMHLNEAESTQ